MPGASHSWKMVAYTKHQQGEKKQNRRSFLKSGTSIDSNTFNFKEHEPILYFICSQDVNSPMLVDECKKSKGNFVF